MFLSLQPQTKNTHPVSSSSSPVSQSQTDNTATHTVAIFRTLNFKHMKMPPPDQNACARQIEITVLQKREREIIKVGEEWVYRKERATDY